MRFLIDGIAVDRPSVWYEDGMIKLIDQRALPGVTRIISVRDIGDCADCIRTLAVRGAPAIGVFGALSLALAISHGADPQRAYGALITTRPTAVDLRNCLDAVMDAYLNSGSEEAMNKALSLSESVIDSCRLIGEKGSHLIGDGNRILTHCNAGALATLDWGTALAPIRVKARAGGDPFVWVSETRPLFQGSRLTAWELSGEGIDHSVIVDSASGHLMSKNMADLIIVGADRVCANGDIANKIGTLEKALIAREYSIPFYVAFPFTTMDPTCPEGGSIPIEVRDQVEIKEVGGTRLAPQGTSAFNPAFDVVPADLITGYITELGVLSPDDLRDRA